MTLFSVKYGLPYGRIALCYFGNVVLATTNADKAEDHIARIPEISTFLQDAQMMLKLAKPEFMS